MEPYDTIVIGAGPVGSHAAYRLACLGYKVMVLEKKASPGDDICCTGILSKECLDTFNIDDNLVLKKYHSAKFFPPSDRYLRLWRESPVAAIIDRPALDKNLAEKAQRAGAEYIFGSRVTSVTPDTDILKVEIERQKEIFEAKTAIVATGFGSTLPEKLGLGKIKHYLSGVQAEVDTDIDEAEVYFDQNLAPGGFAWLVPTEDGKGLAGLLARHQADVYLRAFLNTLSAQGRIISAEASPNYGAIPLRPLPRTYSDRVLVVGEAAGQAKPTTGGGIYYGLLCAEIAAGVLHQAFLSGNFSAKKLSIYQNQWQAKLGRELTIGYWSRRLYSYLSNRFIEHMFHIAARNGIGELITTSEDFPFDWHSRFLLQMASSLLPFPRPAKPL